MVYLVGVIATVIGVATIIARRRIVAAAPGEPLADRPDVKAQLVIGVALVVVGVLVVVAAALR